MNDNLLVLIIGVAFLLFLLIWARISAARTPLTPPVDDEEAAFRLALPERFVVFDLETTGLDATRHEIVEIGAIKVNRDSDIHETFQCLVKPSKRIPKSAARINGISQDMVNQDGEPLATALRDFAEFIEDLPLVSFNADFDMAFLERSAARHGIVIRNRVSCALKMARRAWPGRESYRLSDLARDGNLPLDDEHRALGDCRRTVLVYTTAAVKLSSRKTARRTRLQ